MNRYAIDERLLATYGIPAACIPNARDRMAIVGNTLVLKAEMRLHLLDVNAPAGAKATPTAIRCSLLSYGSVGGRLAGYDRDRMTFFFFNPADQSVEDIVKIPEGVKCHSLELTPAGKIFIGPFEVTGTTIKTSERKLGDNLQYVDGFWFASAWHGTIFRYGPDFSAAPGVVYGGASGSFIGHLDSDEELSYCSGVAKISDTLYAAAGYNAVVMLLVWNEQAQKFFSGSPHRPVH